MLDNLNLTIPTGSIFGLIGINGAGKTTLLRILAGVFRQEQGSLMLEGKPVFEYEETKRKILFLPDEPFFTANSTGNSLAELYKTFYPFDQNVFLHYASEYKLDLKAPVRTFSKGMKRRLFVCLAFASSPKYLLLDEVFDGLDPAARLVFKRGLIDTLERTGGTAIIASHSLRELQDICDSYGLIDGQQILDSGTIDGAVQNLYKFHIAFNRIVKESDINLKCMSYESSGKIIKIVVKGDKDYIMQKINELNPLVVDEVAVDFEEYFISEVNANANNSIGGLV